MVVAPSNSAEILRNFSRSSFSVVIEIVKSSKREPISARFETTNCTAPNPFARADLMPSTASTSDPQNPGAVLRNANQIERIRPSANRTSDSHAFQPSTQDAASNNAAQDNGPITETRTTSLQATYRSGD